MLRKNFKIRTIVRAQCLCILASKQSFPVTLEQGIYCVNAKSIFGIFSLNLTEDVTVVVPEAEGAKEFFERLDTSIDVIE